MTRHKYSDERLAEISARSNSMRSVMLELGIPYVGGNYSHIKRRIVRAGIDISHFLGQAANRGKTLGPKRPPEEVLVYRQDGYGRQTASTLRRNLLAVGREYVCESCGNTGEYDGKPLVLEVDHINNDWLDDRPENLRFLCPNCHSQR